MCEFICVILFNLLYFIYIDIQHTREIEIGHLERFIAHINILKHWQLYII